MPSPFEGSPLFDLVAPSRPFERSMSLVADPFQVATDPWVFVVTMVDRDEALADIMRFARCLPAETGAIGLGTADFVADLAEAGAGRPESTRKTRRSPRCGGPTRRAHGAGR
jgi:hypothetical protein